ncbi:signal peptidase I [Candidatus Peregrinibacteria bacterium]|nr:signal peptidase I [Candidatus Peregrinibacteria bacterium]
MDEETTNPQQPHNDPTPPQNDTRDVSEIFGKKEEEKEPKNQPPTSEKTPEDTTENTANDATEKQPAEPSQTKQEKTGNNNLLTLLLDIGLNLLIVFGLVFVIQSFIASPFKVYGPSMCDTLNNINDECQRGYGEYIIVNKLIYQDFFGWSLSQPSRGDIIVFHPPHSEEQFYIKRIIGLPGDTIKIIDGEVFLFNDAFPTGHKLDEPYLNEVNGHKTKPSTNQVTTFDVPEGQFFVMGDNRRQSTDSRSCFRDVYEVGCRGEGEYFLPEQNIEGKASVVLWPLGKIRTLKDVTYF